MSKTNLCNFNDNNELWAFDNKKDVVSIKFTGCNNCRYNSEQLNKIYHLINLESLNLSCTSICSVPQCIIKLVNLKYLSIYDDNLLLDDLTMNNLNSLTNLEFFLGS